MYKVFANRLPIVLTSKAKYLSNKNTFLLSSLEIDEILKKLRKHKKIYLFFPKKKDLIKEFKYKGFINEISKIVNKEIIKEIKTSYELLNKDIDDLSEEFISKDAHKLILS